MSVRGLNEVAVQRDLGGAQRVAEQPKTTDESHETKAQGYLDLLVTAIPTEPLALYTFVIAGIVATIGSEGDQRLLMRWIIFGVTAAFIAVWMVASYLRQAHSSEKPDRVLPLPEILTAVIAFGAWGLAMPESPLIAELSGTDKTVWTVIIIGAGAALVGLLTGTLKKPSKVAPAPEDEKKCDPPPCCTPQAEAKDDDRTPCTPQLEKKPEGVLGAIALLLIAIGDALRSRKAAASKT
jgi:hypothetical protein